MASVTQEGVLLGATQESWTWPPPLGSQSASHGQAGALPKAALMAAQLHLPAHHPAAILVPSRGSLRSNQT